MKNISFSTLLITLALLLFISCKSTKSSTSSASVAYTPTGIWKYEVTDTPEGDSSGELILTSTASGYSGKISGRNGETDLKNLSVSDKKMACTIMVEGYEAEINGSFDGDNFAGKISVAGYDFPMTATRKK